MTNYNDPANTGLKGTTGSGNFVGATSPTLVTPLLGTPASGTLTSCTGLPLAGGGTNANLAASNGGIFYSSASALAILSGTSTAGQALLSGASTTPTWSTATYPATAGTSGNVLTSDGTNWVSMAPAAGAGGVFNYSVQTPTTGFSITIGNTINSLVLTPAGTLSTGTITMPASPSDGQVVFIASTQQITTLTMAANAGQSLWAAFSAELFKTGAGGVARGLQYIYKASNTTWYPLGATCG